MGRAFVIALLAAALALPEADALAAVQSYIEGLDSRPAQVRLGP